MFDAVLIAGPTASGKSALAIKVAQAFGGVVINADSMQVYRDLRIITARPTPEEEASAPHLLFGHVDAAVNYSAGMWARDAARAIADVRGKGLLPVIAGGTGLYFRALREGLSAMPVVPDEIREKVRQAAQGQSSVQLHDQLASRDPLMAQRLRPSDRQRVLRALEVLEASGRSLASFQGQREAGVLADARCLSVFLAPEREALYARINARFEAMMREGAMEEVRALGARNLDPALPAMRAHGVPGLLAHVRGESSLDAAIIRGQADTRHYSKRQYTWFRHQAPDFEWVAPERAYPHLVERLAAR